MFNRNDYFDIEQIVQILGCSHQNIYQAIWKGRLRAIKYDGVRYVKKEWFNQWRANYRTGKNSSYNGHPTFDEKKGELSVKEVARILDKREQHVYYLIREGRLPCERKGLYVIIHKDDLQAFLEKKKAVKYA